MFDHLTHILMSALSWFGSFSLAALLVGLLAYAVGRVRKTVAAGETPTWRPHPAWATPARAACAAAFASLILWGVLAAWPVSFLRMFGCALAFICVVGITPAAYRPGGAAWSVIVALVPFAAYMVTGLMTQDFMAMAAVGLICVGVLRGWLGIPDYAYYAAAPPEAAAAGMRPRHLILPDNYLAQIRDRIVGQALAKSLLVSVIARCKAFFSSAISTRPLVWIIAGPVGSGRHYLARQIGEMFVVGAAEPENVRIDWHKHLMDLRLAGSPSVNLVRADVDLGREAREWLGHLCATGRHSAGDDWGRALLIFCVDVDQALAAGAKDQAGKDALLAVVRAKLDPRIVAVGHLIVTTVPTVEDQCGIAEATFRREARRHHVAVTEIADDAMADVVTKANNQMPGMGISEAVDIAATVTADHQFAALRAQKATHARIAATGAVEAVPAPA